MRPRPLSSRHVDAVLRAIAYYEILGASWSLRAAYEVMAHTRGVLIPWSSIVLIAGAYGLVAVAGFLLLKRRESGEVLSYVAQALQVLHVTAGPLALSFVAGLEASIYFVGKRITYFIGLSATFNYLRDSGYPRLAIGVNFVPVLLLAVLLYLPDVGSTTVTDAGSKVGKSA